MSTPQLETPFDDRLREIPHYQHYPIMMPFVGPQYGSGVLQKVLLVGESNYMPPDSTIHQDAEKWYASDQSALTSEELVWINNRALVSGDWAPAGHMIYRELNRRMEEVVDIATGRAMDHVAYVNAFQRPAPVTGQSIGRHLTKKDQKVAREVLTQVIEVLSPSHVIIVSKLAWNNLGGPVSNSVASSQFYNTCHPGTGGRYWHRAEYADGVDKFRRIISACVS